MEVKRLYRSSADRVFFGVCGGFAEYLDVDPLIVRLLFVLLSLMVGSGIFLYIVCALLIPDEEKAARMEEARRAYYYQKQAYERQPNAAPQPGPAPERPVSYQERAAYGSAGAKTSVNPGGAGKAQAPVNDGMPGTDAQSGAGAQNYGYGGPGEAERSRQLRGDNTTLGAILVAIGGLVLLKYLVPRLSTTLIFAVLCIAAGIYFILRKK